MGAAYEKLRTTMASIPATTLQAFLVLRPPVHDAFVDVPGIFRGLKSQIWESIPTRVSRQTNATDFSALMVAIWRSHRWTMTSTDVQAHS